MINTHHNIGLKRMRLLKCIAVIEDNRASGKRQCIRGEEFCLYQNNRIIHQDTTISVIGVISVDRKSTRLNSSHVAISYAVFCLKKKKKKKKCRQDTLITISKTQKINP